MFLLVSAVQAPGANLTELFVINIPSSNWLSFQPQEFCFLLSGKVGEKLESGSNI